MDKLWSVVRLVWNHGNKYVYLVSLLALFELGYLYGYAMLDGKIDKDEHAAIKAASERVVESLPV